MKGRNWKGNSNCTVCRLIEIVDHIFFECPVAKFAWEELREAMGWDRAPRGMQDFETNWLPLGCDKYVIKLYSFAMVL